MRANWNLTTGKGQKRLQKRLQRIAHTLMSGSSDASIAFAPAPGSYKANKGNNRAAFARLAGIVTTKPHHPVSPSLVAGCCMRGAYSRFSSASYYVVSRQLPRQLVAVVDHPTDDAWSYETNDPTNPMPIHDR